MAPCYLNCAIRSAETIYTRSLSTTSCSIIVFNGFWMVLVVLKHGRKFESIYRRRRGERGRDAPMISREWLHQESAMVEGRHHLTDGSLLWQLVIVLIVLIVVVSPQLYAASFIGIVEHHEIWNIILLMLGLGLVHGVGADLLKSILETHLLRAVLVLWERLLVLLIATHVRCSWLVPFMENFHDIELIRNFIFVSWPMRDTPT